jgi:two-component system chemotaxis response regulator CheB
MMPTMDGLSFLEAVMKCHPLPVVIISSLSCNGSDIMLKAFETGAVACIQKQSATTWNGILHVAEEIVSSVREASTVQIRKPCDISSTHCRQSISPARTVSDGKRKDSEMIVAIGSSAGGTRAIEAILTSLPPSAPGIVIAQHMPPVITAAFAERLNGCCGIRVKEARAGDKVQPGLALIAPGDRQLTIRQNGHHYITEVDSKPMLNFARPSVDVLFSAVALHAGSNAIGIILSGMGTDGAKGLLEMKKAGAVTIAQDNATSLVFGMPGHAIDTGAADMVAPLHDIPGLIMQNI